MKLKAIVGKKNKVADRSGRKRKNYLNKSSTSCSVVIKSDPDENVAPEALLESPETSKGLNARLRSSVRKGRPFEVRNCVAFCCQRAQAKAPGTGRKCAKSTGRVATETRVASAGIKEELVTDNDSGRELGTETVSSLPALTTQNFRTQNFSVILTPLEKTLNRGARRSLRRAKRVKLTPRTLTQPLNPVQILGSNVVYKAISSTKVKAEPLDDVVPMSRPMPKSIFICDKCLKFYKRATFMEKHECNLPAGIFDDAIYTQGNIRIYQIDGAKHQQYCCNLTKLSKCYVNALSGWKHATFFHFYVLYVDGSFAGFFSKQKNWTRNNLGAIMVLPKLQRKGYGKLLIAVSYELSKREKTVSTPERPFTPAGFRCYLSYWCEILGNYLSQSRSETLCVERVSKATYLHPQDILTAAKSLGPSNVLEGQQHIRNMFKNQKIRKEGIFDAKYLRWNPKCLSQSWYPHLD